MNNLVKKGKNSPIVTTTSSGNNKLCTLKNVVVGTKYLVSVSALNTTSDGAVNPGFVETTDCTGTIIAQAQQKRTSGYQQCNIAYIVPNSTTCSFSYTFGSHYTGNQIDIYVGEMMEG